MKDIAKAIIAICIFLIGLFWMQSLVEIFKQPSKPKPSVQWGVADSTLIIGTNRFEIEVGLNPDGTLQYRKGKQK